MNYTEQQLAATDEKIMAAYDALVALQTEYKDVIAIPEVISVRDIVDYRINTDYGIKQFKEVYGPDTAEKVLNIIRQTNFVTPATIENAIVAALHNQEDMQ